MLLVWDWDKIIVTAKINIGITGIPPCVSSEVEGVEADYNFQISYNPNEAQYMLVTGPDTFKYYEIDKENQISPSHTQINNTDPNR